MSGDVTVLPKGSFSAALREKPKTGRDRPQRRIRLYGGVQRWPSDGGMASEFALLVSVTEGGKFVRIPMSLPQARLWLRECLDEVEGALGEGKP